MPEDTPQMPVPFGIDEDTGLPLNGIVEASLEAFKQADLESPLIASCLKHKAAQSDPHNPEKHFGVVKAVKPNEPDQAGWSVMFAPSADQRIREALQPLLDHRKKQVGNDKLFRVFEGAAAYHPGDTAADWLGRTDDQRPAVSMDVVD